MPLDAILNGIQQVAQKQVAEINKQAEVQLKAVEAKTASEVEAIRNNAILEGKSRISKKQALLDQQTKLKSLQILADARQKLIESVLNDLQIELKNFRSSPGYPLVLSELIDQAINTLKPSLLPQQKIQLLLDKRDVEKKPVMLKEYSSIQVVFDLDCFGGCVAQSEDGQVRVLNTLEDRFSRALPILKTQLSIFFDQKWLS
jgi:vacuolar-type H+-ATPase subunit E/Vma4